MDDSGGDRGTVSLLSQSSNFGALREFRRLGRRENPFLPPGRCH